MSSQTDHVGADLRVLSPGFGYGILIGIGGAFTLIMIGVTILQNKYSAHSSMHSEEFNTASRSVKPGLIVTGIVSSWTWSATLLTSATFAYNYGISGPMWFAAVGSSQVLMFSLLSLKMKRDLPGAHTFPEIVLARHGPVAHAVYLAFGWITNLLIGTNLVLGGAQVISGMSGVNVYAACFIIPFTVAIYVVQGGLRSTFVADYLHTVILFVAILAFAFQVYTADDYIGSPGRMWELLMEAAERSPIAGNAEGSWLTFHSDGGLIFAGVLFLGGFSTVWLDQAYWQRAIASKPETSVKAYLAGGLAWYGIPFSFATAMGLGAVALTNSPRFPTYPNPLTAAQVGGGFSAPATAIALMGTNGAALMILLLFMAITSATSAELIAVSSLWTFDIYKQYINPSASSKKLVMQSHYSIVVFSLVLAAFCCALSASGIDITWIITCVGVIVGGGGIPLAFVVLFPKWVSTPGAIAAPLIAMPLGFVAWFATTHIRSGVISVATTGEATNALAGSSTTCGIGAILVLALSWVFPSRYTSDSPTHTALVEKVTGVATVHAQPPPPKTTSTTPAVPPPQDEEKNISALTSTHQQTPTEPEGPSKIETGNEVIDFLLNNHIEPLDSEAYHKALRLAIGVCLLFIVFAMLTFPFAFYGTSFIFTKAAFTGWVVVSLIWAFCSALACIVWPVAESFGELVHVGRTLLGM
ncbi:solute symporter family transporter [Aspergillus karnatakaensis]|uniref:sodium:solute symporter family protein n=1 Tax=Aspergillus karnatakaensis TaxID=1810916 RepID=UPI003CCD8BA2